MASSSLQQLCQLSLFSLAFISTVTVATASFRFKVGEGKGWTKPTGNQSQTYNEWASRNRFHVGDFLYFKYINDSVLEVNRTSYANCSVADPIFKFDDGETVIEFDRHGFFYFISGEQGHCQAGQKLVVRVMVHSAAAISSPQPTPSPMEGGASGDDGDGWDTFWGPPPHNSTIKQTVASYFMTALGGMLVIMYLLM